ncbi:hypothetical protein E8E14_012024 [Neopestalotiopsis sp. 37M]|nr:hypothetical protein E8E14_012024 [Neopestalotiopsis sp. 37M]
MLIGSHQFQVTTTYQEEKEKREHMPSGDDERERCNREQDQQDTKDFAEQFYDEEYEQTMDPYADDKRGGKKVKGTTPKPPPAPEPTNNPK